MDVWHVLLKLHQKIVFKLITRLSAISSRKSLRNLTQTSDTPGLSNNRSDVIVSLTSIPSRISFTHLAIESILRQSVQPDKIVLWLDEARFNLSTIPGTLTNLQSRGLEIRFVEDLFSHTKYFYAMQEWPEAAIITVDDDIYYHKNTLRRLLESYQQYPTAVSCMRAHQIVFDGQNRLHNYANWNWCAFGIAGPRHDLLQTGVGGVLYPPKTLHPDTFDKDLFLKLCPKADDIWLKVMLLINDTKVRKTGRYTLEPIDMDNSQENSLNSSNVWESMNDKQLNAVLAHYGIDLEAMLKE